jgi:hypothetical protein
VLRAVGVQVDLLVRVLAEVVRGHIAGNDHHRNAIERRVRNTRRSVRQSWPQVCEQHGRLAGCPCITVCGVGRDLFVTHVDELDAAGRHRGEDRDVRVAA